MKSRNDYKVSGYYIGDAIEAYIDKGILSALDFIKNQNLDNDYIKHLISDKNEREKQKKEDKKLWMA